MAQPPASTLRLYTNNIRQALSKALCLQTFPSQNIERHNSPQIEVADSPELLLPPVTITRSSEECCLIEPSINSMRISLRVGKSDALEGELLKMYMRFLMQRAEALSILRRKPLPGYDVSFLITDGHVLEFGRTGLAEFVCWFIEEVDAEVKALKLAVNARGRAVATELLRSLAF